MLSPLESYNNSPDHKNSLKKIRHKDTFFKSGFIKPKGCNMHTNDGDTSQITNHHSGVANSIMGSTHKINEDGMFIKIIDSFSSFNYI